MAANYELQQFEADLERAQALSLESLALEQFKQSRLSSEERSECDGRSRSVSSGAALPAIPPPPRRPARRAPTLCGGGGGSTESPGGGGGQEDDLISFNAPSSSEKSRLQFKEQIDQIHRLCSQTDSSQSLVPYASPAAMNPLIPFPAYAAPQYSRSSFDASSNPIKPDYSRIGFLPPSNIYPNLASMQNVSHPTFNAPFGTSNNVPATNQSLAKYAVASPSSCPHLSSLTNQNNNATSSHGNFNVESSGGSNTTMPANNLGISLDEIIMKNVESSVKSLDVNETAASSQSGDSVKRDTASRRTHLAPLNVHRAHVSPKSDIDKWIIYSQKSENLIDLASNAIRNPETSDVLEAFDPLAADQNCSDYGWRSECSSSIYEEFDPLDFLYSESKSQKETPVYAVVTRKGTRDSMLSPLPSPPPKSLPPTTPTIKRSNTLNKKLYETISGAKTRKYDSELKSFLQLIKDIRGKYKYNDPITNPGYVVAAKSEGRYPRNTSIKLLVHYKDYSPIAFTCDVESTVEHVILHVVCELEGEIREDVSTYTVRVWGMNEYLTPGSSLSDYTYVRQCVRLEKDILLCLQSTTYTNLARVERDDARDAHISLDRIMPNQSAIPPISHHNLSILLETLERELSRVTSVVAEGGNVRIGATAQAVKAICALLGGVETVQITTALGTLVHACNQASPSPDILKPEIVSDAGDYSNVSLRQATLKDTVGLHCQRLREAVRAFISIYCRTNRVDFELDDNHYSSSNHDVSVAVTSINETALFCIEGVHRPPINWNHDEFVIHAQIYYGTTCLKGSQSTSPYPTNTHGFYPRILFETWLNLNEINIAKLPKEARLVLTLYGRTLAKPDNQNATASEKDKAAAEAMQKDSPEKRDISEDSDSSLVPMEQEELGWSAIQLFDYDGILISGTFILPIWPVCANKRLGPAPDITDSPPQPHPLMLIEIPSYSAGVVHWKDFNANDNHSMNANRHSFESLDIHTQQQLMHLVEQGPHQKMPSECREILWEKRHYLVEIPGALPLVLLASVNWDAFSRWSLLQILDQWQPLSPYDALHLLLPCFPDECVRAKAVEWLSAATADVLISLMPQLCLALRYECHIASPLTRLLMSRSLESPRFAHRLYWQLVHDIPGSCPQNSSEEYLGMNFDGDPFSGIEMDDSIVSTFRWVRRNQIILRALLEIVGGNLAERLLKQQLLVKGLSEVANSIKKCKENVRNRNLVSGVNSLIPLVTSNNVCLPLSISQEVYDIDMKTCSYFPSFTLPLKISFISSDRTIIPAIFKIGDDLRQDSLVLQVMRVMDQLWLKEGLDLSMVTFEAVPTQYRKGIIEMVCDAETLRSIQIEWGLTGSFKDKPIAEWLAKHNPSELEYERAVTNFTASCAGYSVATYLLGICDRHNDNIMLKTSGHLFHIDFGKFLGDAQMFGNFKRDRTPFVLTPDMAYVINGGERPSQKFHYFVDLCCTAFNIIRKHQNLILNLFSLMASSGINGVSASAVGYVRAALLPGQTPAEAAAAFARLIHSALKSKFTPINFFLHNLAQLRAGDQAVSSPESLSFMPKTYTMEQDGRIVNVEVLGYEKRYEPEKYYVYALRIFRQGQATPSILYRSYKHFCELYQKICLEHPLARLYRLPVGLHMGRSNTKYSAERRFGDIKAFLISLFVLADEISHSKLVYTFFHPLLRDQQDVGPQRLKHKNDLQQNVQNGVGALKVSVQYSAGVFSVLILHAQSLPMTPQGVPPSPYVKVYLLPDPSKETKRKTRVLKRNCHPSFMEMVLCMGGDDIPIIDSYAYILEYRLPLEVIRGRDLEVTVWHHDPLQENQFLGGIMLQLHSMPLNSETAEWYPLQYIPRHS